MSRAATAFIRAGEQLEQLVAGQIGEIIKRLDTLFAERHQHPGCKPLEGRQIVGDAKLHPPLFVFNIASL